MVKIYLLIALLVTSLLLFASSMILKGKSKLSALLFFLSLLPVLVLSFLAWRFSPSYCALFTLLSAILIAVWAFYHRIIRILLPKMKWLPLLGLPLLLLALGFALPNIYVFSHQDDLLSLHCYLAMGASLLFLALIALWNHFHKKDIFERIHFDSAETACLIIGLFGFLCGIRHTPLIPYGIGFLFMALSYFLSSEGKLRSFFSDFSFFLGFGVSIFYTLTPAIVL